MCEYPSDASPGSRPRRASCKARWGAWGTIRVEGPAGKRIVGSGKRRIAGSGQQKTLPPPKRGSPTLALIVFVVRFRLSEGVARNAIFIQKDASEVLVLP